MHNLGVNIGKYTPSWRQGASADVIFGEKNRKSFRRKGKNAKNKGRKRTDEGEI
jgi:hypothetical protein